MSRAARFLLVLFVGIGALTWGAYVALTRTTRDWFVGDVDLRARLAARTAQRALTQRWADGDVSEVHEILADITRDKRIMGARACTNDGAAWASTDAFPQDFSCSSIVSSISADAPDGDLASSLTRDLPDGTVHLSVFAIGAPRLGYLVLAHDLSFIQRREATTKSQVLLGFFVLALAASGFTLIAAWLAQRAWAQELRLAILGQPTTMFRALVGDVRELVDTLLREREGDANASKWTPERLRAVLTEHLHGERIVILANREPYIHQLDDAGQVKVLHPASGLVTALEPVLRACSGVWVAHGSGSADRATVDEHDRIRVPPGEESYVVRRVWLTDEEESRYYFGFSNEGLWPLCHVADARPTFRAEDWAEYVRVNRRFADIACEEVDVDDPIILVQDYHFALAPRMIRERLPRATILTFWHIPWPNAERLGICPYRKELLEGLLGSSIVGFHTQQHCNHFTEAVDAFLEARVDRENHAVIQQSQRTLVRPYPIALEWPVHWLSALPDAATCRQEVFATLGLAPDALLGVGVDRLDYTKGIEERLLAVDNLLERYPAFRGRFTFLQVAAPSRTRIERYQSLNDRVEALTQSINERWGVGSYRPIILLREHHEPPSVFRFYRAANVCYVSSLHDGMNLVAKEFVAARDDEAGVLVLSQFTGAARELTEALIVNPYDLQQAGDALAAALSMSQAEQRERMRSMRRLVAEFNIYRWAGRMLVDAAQIRRRERLTGRLSKWGAARTGVS
ncbi:MAG: alpha,alpha-trehalose-phosphate synthase (UDP-forming) [Byssovorax sp.]